MKRILCVLWGLGLAAGLLSAAGCGDSCCHSVGRCAAEFGPDAGAAICSHPVVARPSYPPALLFDRHPSYIPVSAFAIRSDWPSTESFYPVGETVLYSRRFVSRQGPGFPHGHNDWTFLYLDSVRVGAGFR